MLASFAINERNVGGLSTEVIVAIIVPIVGSALVDAAVIVLTTILLKKNHHPTIPVLKKNKSLHIEF